MQETLVREPGFVSGEMYRSDKMNTGLNFINVTRWQNDLCAQEHTLASNAKLAQIEVEVIRTPFSVHSEY